ncbi:MAG: hypothetical protein ACRCX2_18460 [Paraclostridium sp.]
METENKQKRVEIACKLYAATYFNTLARIIQNDSKVDALRFKYASLTAIQGAMQENAVTVEAKMKSNLYKDLEFRFSISTDAGIEQINMGEKNLVEKKSDDFEKTTIEKKTDASDKPTVNERSTVENRETCSERSTIVQNISYRAHACAKFKFSCFDCENNIYFEIEERSATASIYFDGISVNQIGKASDMSEYIKGCGGLYSYLVRYSIKNHLALSSEDDIEQYSNVSSSSTPFIGRGA